MEESCLLCLSTFAFSVGVGGTQHGLSSLFKLVQRDDEWAVHDDDDGVFVLCPPCDQIMDNATQLQIKLKTEVQRIRNLMLETEANAESPENVRKIRKSFIELSGGSSTRNDGESINGDSVVVKIEEESNQFDDDFESPSSPSAFMISPEEDENEGISFDEEAIKLEKSDDEADKLENEPKTQRKKTRGEPSRRSTRVRKIADSQDMKLPSPQKKAYRTIYKPKKSSLPRSWPAREFFCAVCDRKFNRRIKLYIHMFKKHETEDKPFSCPKSNCNKKFTLELNLQRHIKLHEKEEKNPLVCEFCDTRYSSQSQLDVHLKYHKGFTCSFCSKICNSHPSFLIHLRSHTGDRPYYCNFTKCKEHFRTLTQKKNHIERVHQISQKHPCNLCDTVLNTTSALKSHLARMHSKQGCFADLKCEVEGCEQVFTSKRTLETHMVKVHGRDPFVCDQCGATLLNARGLRDHKISHLEIRQFKCSICQATFKTSNSLRNHLKTHSAERPFVCTFCGNAFKLRSTLTHHEKRIHSKDFVPKYKWTCPHCPNKQFEWKHLMECHIRQFHTGEKPFACHVQSCSQSFALKSSLTQHLKSHGIINRVRSTDRAPRTKRDVNCNSSPQKRKKRDQNEDEESKSSKDLNNDQISFGNQLYYQNL